MDTTDSACRAASHIELPSLMPVVRAVLVFLVLYLGVKLRKASAASKQMHRTSKASSASADYDVDDDEELGDARAELDTRHAQARAKRRARNQHHRSTNQFECTCQLSATATPVPATFAQTSNAELSKNHDSAPPPSATAAAAAAKAEVLRRQALDMQMQMQLQCKNPRCSSAAKSKLKLPPGPIGLPFVGYLPFVGPQIHLTLTSLSQKYGPIYQIYLGGIRVLVLNDATLIRQAFKQPVFSGRPDTQLTRLLQGYGIVNSGGALWKEQRAFLHSTLRKLGAKTLMSGSNGLEAKIQTQVREFINDLSGHIASGKSCQVRPILARAVSSVVGSIVMNLTYRKFEEKPKFDRLIELMQEGFRLFTIAMPLDFIPIFRFLPGVSYAYKKMKKNRAETSAFFKSIADEHRKYLSEKFNLISTSAEKSNHLALHPEQHHHHQNSNLPQSQLQSQADNNHKLPTRPPLYQQQQASKSNTPLEKIVARDLVDAYIVQQTKHENDGKANYFSDQQLIQIMSDIFSAGLETVTSTIEWSILFLILNKGCQRKIQVEIDNVIGRERMPQLEDLSHMPYTEATIYEVLRRSNVIALGNTHATLADASLGGYRVPKGTHVLPNLYGIHMNPDLWNEPTKFDPTRFIVNEKAHKPDYFIPFSVGRRMCLGDVLAKMEVFLFLVSLLQKYDLQIADEDKDCPPQVKGTIGVSNAPAAFRTAIKVRKPEPEVEEFALEQKQANDQAAPSPPPSSSESAYESEFESESEQSDVPQQLYEQQDFLANITPSATTATAAIVVTATNTATANTATAAC